MPSTIYIFKWDRQDEYVKTFNRRFCIIIDVILDNDMNKNNARRWYSWGKTYEKTTTLLRWRKIFLPRWKILLKEKKDFTKRTEKEKNIYLDVRMVKSLHLHNLSSLHLAFFFNILCKRKDNVKSIFRFFTNWIGLAFIMTSSFWRRYQYNADW